MKLFEPFTLKNMSLKNRIVMPPMCMYQADGDGNPTFFHLNHYATRALGGAGLIIVESTGVLPIGRITDNDLGLWDDSQIAGLKKIADVAHQNGAKIALQLNHAGRKSTSLSGQPVAPSPIAYSGDYRTPQELTKEQIKDIVLAFQKAAERALEAGFDGLEIHAAHGYLLHEFLSPLSNHRTDEYGGSVENRAHLLKEVLQAVLPVWPREKPLWMRVSSFDYQEGGIDGPMMVQIVRLVREYIDMVHVSTGGLTPVPVHDYPGYQVPFAEKIRRECSLPTIAVGLVTDKHLAEEILENGRADLVSFGRKLLRDPYFPIKTAKKVGVEGYVPKPYERAFR